MNLIQLESKITFLSGRPSTGKTNTAIGICRNLLDENWKVIYYHAEGSRDASPSAYGASTPDQLLSIKLVTNLFFDLDELRSAIDEIVEEGNSQPVLVVIDCLELFDCEPQELFHLIREYKHFKSLRFLILTLLPRYLERKTKDHAEEYVRNTYPTDVENQIKILGKFAG
jgi:DNA polymerase III delta prime subunit